MTPETANDSLLQWMGWVLSLALGLGGLWASIWVLKIRLAHAEQLAKIKDKHDAVDKTIKSLNDFEDITLSYWTEKESKYSKANIVIAHQRLIACTRQLCNLSETSFPSEEISDLRRHATLDMESKKRPISSSSTRVIQLTISISKLSSSELLQKKWGDSNFDFTPEILRALREKNWLQGWRKP